MIESIDIERCTGCGICDAVCPADVIHMEAAPVAPEIAGLTRTKLLPVIKFREHCITCFSCEIFCPEKIVDVHPSVKNRPRPW
jgi:Pyruvate/2-oxoacid:ferredoxin oxidoreductase delta subunit